MLLWNKEVADILGIGDSTLRKWCLCLEEKGITFSKDDQNNRAFSERDLVLLKKLKEKMRTRRRSLKNAVEETLEEESRTDVVSVDNDEERPTRTDLVPFKENVVDFLREKLDAQETFNKILLERLEGQENFNKKLVQKLDQIEQRDKERYANLLTEWKRPWWKKWKRTK